MLFTIGGRTKTGFFHFEYNNVSELELLPLSSEKTENIIHEYKHSNLYFVYCVRVLGTLQSYHLSAEYLGQ